MHPLISLVSFLLFAMFVSFGHINLLIAAMLLLLVFWIKNGSKPTPRAWRMIRKMKLFFGSIFILYVWFTPGKLVFPGLDKWSPTYDGLLYGGERIAALIILVFGVDTLLNVLSREKILSGLYYFFYPLHVLRFNRNAFMIRTYLTLEAVTEHRVSVTYRGEKRKLRRVGDYIDLLTNRIKQLIETTHLDKLEDEIVIEIDGPPVWYQWMFPLLLLAYFLGVNWW